mmetsp:Transcript_5791/g.9138  ORF Transcript_5791/g.9138 Transcript_5791/m.9138 type:complete len:201 (-) Transcript_5791:562-1164(-)
MSDEFASFLNCRRFTSTAQDDSVVFVNFGLLASSQMLWRHVFQLHSSVFRNDRSSSQERQILHSRLTVVAKSRSLDSTNLDACTKFVNNQGCQGFAFYVFRDDQQRCLALDDGLQNWKQLLHAAHLLLDQQDVRVIQDALLGLGIGDKVRTNVPTFKLHTFDNFQFVLQGLAVLNGDDTLLADPLHGIRDEVTNLDFRVC